MERSQRVQRCKSLHQQQPRYFPEAPLILASRSNLGVLSNYLFWGGTMDF